jgi:hypothetical protein
MCCFLEKWDCFRSLPGDSRLSYYGQIHNSAQAGYYKYRVSSEKPDTRIEGCKPPEALRDLPCDLQRKDISCFLNREGTWDKRIISVTWDHLQKNLGWLNPITREQTGQPGHIVNDFGTSELISQSWSPLWFWDSLKFISTSLIQRMSAPWQMASR